MHLQVSELYDGSKMTTDKHYMIIDGKKCSAANGKWLKLKNPATGEMIGEAPAGGSEDVELAVSAAYREFSQGEWSRFSAKERARHLNKLADLIESRLPEIAVLEARNNGRPVAETRAQVGIVPDFFRYYASLALTFQGKTVPVGEGYHQYMNYAPIGVVAVMTPFNHPLLIAARGVAPALAAGNTVVLKPSELTPVTSILLVELAIEAGLPPAALNLVNGTGIDAGAALSQHSKIARIEFTGGTETGRKIATDAAQRFGRVTAELGGKTSVLVFEDADLADAAAGVAFAGFIAAGQSCVAGSRIMVHEDILTTFLDQLVPIARGLQLGDPLDESTQLGPVISVNARDRIRTAIDAAKASGGRILSGGAIPEMPEHLQDGYWIEPTIIEVEPSNAVTRTELFGPVISIETFREEEEAVSRANSTEFGLGAAIWTRDVGRAHRVAQQMHAGMTWINDHHRLSPSMPWGGFKESGIGKQAGEASYQDFLEERSIILRTMEGAPAWFVDNDTSRLN